MRRRCGPGCHVGSGCFVDLVRDIDLVVDVAHGCVDDDIHDDIHDDSHDDLDDHHRCHHSADTDDGSGVVRSRSSPRGGRRLGR